MISYIFVNLLFNLISYLQAFSNCVRNKIFLFMNENILKKQANICQHVTLQGEWKFELVGSGFSDRMLMRYFYLQFHVFFRCSFHLDLCNASRVLEDRMWETLYHLSIGNFSSCVLRGEALYTSFLSNTYPKIFDKKKLVMYIKLSGAINTCLRESSVAKIPNITP